MARYTVLQAAKKKLWKIPVHRMEQPLSYGSCFITHLPEGSF